jgi:hypothetical protein
MQPIVAARRWRGKPAATFFRSLMKPRCEFSTAREGGSDIVVIAGLNASARQIPVPKHTPTAVANFK